MSAAAAEEVLRRLLSMLESSLYAHAVPVESEAIAVGYIREKILGKAEQSARMSPTIRHILTRPDLVVNGERHPGLRTLTHRLLASPDILREIGCFERSAVHGDLTLENVLYRAGRFAIIDPNGDNRVSDVIVDVAKLFQSLHSGYESLCASPDVAVDGCVIRFAAAPPAVFATLHRNLNERFRRCLPPHRHRALLFHEAVHYMRLLPYRIELVPETAPAFLGVAVRLLDMFMRQYG
jgi:hypothetical protein